MQLVFLKNGVESIEVREEIGHVMFIGSRVVFFAVYTRVLGSGLNVIAGVPFLEAGLMVWRWSIQRHSGERDVEKSG